MIKFLKIFLGILIGLIIIVVGYFGFLEYKSWRISKLLYEPVVPPPYDLDLNKKSINGWKTYKNEKLGFRFNYPAEWSLNESLRNSEFDVNRKAGRVEVGKLLILINNDGAGFEGARYFYEAEVVDNKIRIINKTEQKTSDLQNWVTIGPVENAGNNYFMLYDYDANNQELDLNNLDQILSSFVFTN